MRDENGNLIPDFLVQIYHLQNIDQRRVFSRWESVWVYTRLYKVHGDIDEAECKRVLKLMFETYPERKLREIRWYAERHECVVEWEQKP